MAMLLIWSLVLAIWPPNVNLVNISHNHQTDVLESALKILFIMNQFAWLIASKVIKTMESEDVSLNLQQLDVLILII
jgi:hypothetical protein